MIMTKVVATNTHAVSPESIVSMPFPFLLHITQQLHCAHAQIVLWISAGTANRDNLLQRFLQYYETLCFTSFHLTLHPMGGVLEQLTYIYKLG
jgi:hypothetical protein